MKQIIGIVAFCFLIGSVNAQSKERPTQPDLPGSLMIDVGWNGLSGESSTFDTKAWPSRSLGLYYTQSFIFGKFALAPAVGFGFEKFGFAGKKNFVVRDDQTVVFDTLQDADIIRNKLAVNYFELPIEIRWYPMGTVEGEGMFLGVGSILGARINAHTKIKYGVGQQKRTQKDKANFGLSDYRFGLVVRYGVPQINIFYKQYFTPLFKSGKEPGQGDPNLFTIGLNFTGF